MPEKASEVLHISRLLTPENRATLLTWVQLAYAAEKSAKKPQIPGMAKGNGFGIKQQEYSC